MPDALISGPLVSSDRTRAMSLPTVTPWVQASLLLKVIRPRSGLAQFTNCVPLPTPATDVAMTLAGTLTIWSSILKFQ